jgi:hypothetical protein
MLLGDEELVAANERTVKAFHYSPVAYGNILMVVISKLQKYNPEYFLNKKNNRIRISIPLYQAIAVKAVIDLGILLSAPYMS